MTTPQHVIYHYSLSFHDSKLHNPNTNTNHIRIVHKTITSQNVCIPFWMGLWNIARALWGPWIPVSELWPQWLCFLENNRLAMGGSIPGGVWQCFVWKFFTPRYVKCYVYLRIMKTIIPKVNIPLKWNTKHFSPNHYGISNCITERCTFHQRVSMITCSHEYQLTLSQRP